MFDLHVYFECPNMNIDQMSDFIELDLNTYSSQDECSN